MAGFTTKTFAVHDDYMTPKYAWENIQHLLPRDKVIWECFYGNGSSGTYLEELGFNVIHESIDFYEHDLGDIIVTNPPFSQSKAVLARLKEIGKPFVMIMPSSKINTQYVRSFFQNDKLQIIIPRRRIQFIKTVDGVVPENYKSCCNFDCLYYCWNMNLAKDIIWLE